MTVKTWFPFALCAGLLPACSSSNSDDLGSCPSGGTSTLHVLISGTEDATPAVDVRDADGETRENLSDTDTLSLPAGRYTLQAARVRSAGTLVGPAYQATIEGTDDAQSVCLRSGATSEIKVRYQREPGSARMWLTQSNGDGAQVMAFDEAQLRELGDQTPSVSLSPRLDNAGAIRVDGQGRLWVGSTTGKLVGYNAARLGASSSSAPDIVLEGPTLCEEAVPCGVNAIAFDAEGALWAATLHRIVKLSPDQLERSGMPDAEVTIDSSDIHKPASLAFDTHGNLWVADSDGGVLRFAAARLTHDVSGGADGALYLQKPGPVELGLSAPEGLAFDPNGNLWVAYFAGNELARITPEQLSRGASMSAPLIPSIYFAVGVEAVLTDLAIDEAGNLWLPGGQGSLYRIDAAELTQPTPTIKALRSAELGSVERLTLNTVAGPLFIAP
jgi:sugar lactone lactonase YvrE